MARKSSSQPSRSSDVSPRKSSSGKLRIGDEWNAINIIARTQTHPLKAVCELAENSLDAGAKEVVILRRRQQDDLFLEVTDDGQGIRCDDDGLPDFSRIATHICDSMKRQLAQQDRAGIHGEFGIGLLSFWGLGENMRIVSAGRDGRLYEMHLARGSQDYTIRPARGELSTGGTRVVVGPLLPATRNIITGEKLQRYLSEELRDRIRSRKAKVRVVDRVNHKQFDVEPREFEGEPMPLAQKHATPFGDLHVELHFNDSDSEDRGVAVCKDGTRVLRDVAELDEFQRSPWNEGRIVGVLDYPALNLAPGTRGGIEPDDRLLAFQAAVSSLEPAVVELLAQRDSAESARASRDILKQVHKALVTALRDLPANEYLFFDLPETRQGLGKNSTPAGNLDDQALRVDLDQVAASKVVAEEDPDQLLLPLQPGPLAVVKINPRNARRKVGAKCKLTAEARDSLGIPITSGVAFQWSVLEGSATLSDFEVADCFVTCAKFENVVVGVEARHAGMRAADQVVVKFLPDLGTNNDNSSKGLPSYRLEPEHGRPWRSRYDLSRNEIIINSAHRDFVASQSSPPKHRRYVGKLYAKEVVLINFPNSSPADILERLVEITLRTEDIL